VALAGLWPLLRALGVSSWREAGFYSLRGGTRQLLVGLLLGTASLMAAAAVLLLTQAHAMQAVAESQLLAKCGKFALIAVSVAVVEEAFFRGGLQNSLQRGWRISPGLVIASGIYSIVHFLSPRQVVITPAEVTWLTGFDYLGQVLYHATQTNEVWRGFITLWLAGMILGTAYNWTRSLWLSIGLHAGWVFTLKLFAWLTRPNGEAEHWWAGASLVDSLLVWPVMLALWGVIWWRCREPKS
jgi:membrane protease YdiL (CAAX protease family)